MDTCPDWPPEMWCNRHACHWAKCLEAQKNEAVVCIKQQKADAAELESLARQSGMGYYDLITEAFPEIVCAGPRHSVRALIQNHKDTLLQIRAMQAVVDAAVRLDERYVKWQDLGLAGADMMQALVGYRHSCTGRRACDRDHAKPHVCKVLYEDGVRKVQCGNCDAMSPVVPEPVAENGKDLKCHNCGLESKACRCRELSAD